MMFERVERVKISNGRRGIFDSEECCQCLGVVAEHSSKLPNGRTNRMG